MYFSAFLICAIGGITVALLAGIYERISDALLYKD